MNPPAAKRTRLAASIRRTLSRVGRRTSSRATDMAVAVAEAEDQDGAGVAAASAREFQVQTPNSFDAVLRAAATAAEAAAPTGMPMRHRNIKVCLVGDMRAGKTALVK